jgi:serine/threonine protein kinase
VSEDYFPQSSTLTPSVAREMDRACDAFEAAWRQGERPKMEVFLRAIDQTSRPRLLRELLRVELAYRRRAGETPTAPEYVALFPEDTALVEEVLHEGAPTVHHAPADTPTRGEQLPPPAADNTPAGTAPWPSVSGYEILAELGRAGMGVVYKARQSSPPRLVALKMIRDGALAGPQHRDRFGKEVKALARFEHQNLVRIYEVGEHAGLPFFSMELAESGSLHHKLSGEPMRPREAAVLVRTIAGAVQYAHDKQVIHRDLKPSNILLAADGRPMVADFGLAKLLDSESRLTPSEAVLGTASYMSPEAALGAAADALPTADVYSLGAILYEILTGRPPFRGPNWQATVQQVIVGDPEPPSRLREEVPAELEAVCLKCLEKEPAQRYPSARELADDLGRWLDGEPVTAVPWSETDRLSRWARAAGFEVEDVLTFGVRDVVFRARHVHNNRRVALKVFTEPAGGEVAEGDRFLREAQSAARLDHPNIIRIYDSGEFRGRTYYAFEYVGGGSLIERYADHPAAPRDAALLVRQLADAVHHAHQSGVLHLALKPSNVLLTEDGAPKIANFGLRPRPSGPDDRRPAFRRLPSYMPPEVASGFDQTVDGRADVYALGAILYKLLTGDPPFVAETVTETLEQVRSRPPAPPSQVNPGVDPALDVICLKCLEKTTGRRYACAADLASALDDFLSPAEGGHKTADEAPRIPGYQVTDKLGEGSLSVVYAARQLSSGRTVALKVYREEYRYGRDLHALLENLAARMAEMRHPNLVDVLECREHRRRPYVSMTLFPAGSLQERLQRLRFTPADAARLTATLARAIDHAHRQGVVHGNLKPSKIVFAADGTPGITGFLLAPLLQERRERTALTMSTPDVLGTPRYMAPEQLSGNTKSVGPAADVYALGLILYESLTGVLPFRAITLMDMMVQVLHESPEPPRQRRPDVPPDLEAICLRCLAKQPAGRYASAGALADDLERFLAGEPISESTSNESQPQPRPSAMSPPVPSQVRRGLLARLVEWITGRGNRSGERR